jgi:hypothetical protein
MHDIIWLREGTNYYQRDDGKFNVFPATQFITGLFSHDNLVQNFGIDKRGVSLFEEEISKSFGLNPDLVKGFSGVRVSKDGGRREATYRITSMSEEDKEYTVVVRNLGLESDPFETKMKCFKNTLFSCDCGLGRYEGEICAMPYEACHPCGIEIDEYERKMRCDKPYGEVACRHVIKTLQLEGVYPFFDQSRFALLFPKAAKTLIGEIEKRGKLKVQEADIILKPYVNTILGLQEIVSYFLKQQRREASNKLDLERLEKEVGTKYIL